MNEQVENDVIKRLDAGDVEGACTAALKGYGPQLLGYLSAVLRDEALASDAFSELSVDLWKGLATFRCEATVRTFAYKLAWHAALRVARDPYEKRRRPLESDQISQLAERIRTETAIHLRSQVKDGIAALRDQLSPEEQTLLILRVDRDLSWSEVADVMELDEPAVRKRYERTKEKLRTLAEKAGLMQKKDR
jgi:RNA polymerase sigma-70 factor (ECF subfamily)